MRRVNSIPSACKVYVDRLRKIPFIRIVGVYQPSKNYCVIDFVDRQFPEKVLEERVYGHYLSSISVDLKAGWVEFNVNKYVPRSREVVEFYLPESVSGPRIHVVFDPDAKRVGVQGSVGGFDDAVELVRQYFQPL